MFIRAFGSFVERKHALISLHDSDVLAIAVVVAVVLLVVRVALIALLVAAVVELVVIVIFVAEFAIMAVSAVCLVDNSERVVLVLGAIFCGTSVRDAIA